MKRKCGRYNVGDARLPNGHIVKDVPSNYVLVHCGTEGKQKMASAVVDALETIFSKKQVSSTGQTSTCHASYAAAFPMVTTDQQATSIDISLPMHVVVGNCSVHQGFDSSMELLGKVCVPRKDLQYFTISLYN